MRLLSAMLMMIAAPSFSGDLQVQGCEASDTKILCQIRNADQQAVASIVYRVTAGETGRAVAWAEVDGRQKIPGGIEPGEMLTLAFPLPPLPERARGRDIAYLVSAVADQVAVSSWDAGPLSITGTDADHDEQRAAFANSVERCWNVSNLSTAAVRTRVLIGFEVAADGRPVPSSIRLIESSGGLDDAVSQAYEAARRAILRCGAQGLPAMDGARQMTLAFEPDGIR